MSAFKQVVKVAETYVADHDPAECSWSWGEALLMYSLSQLDDALGEPRFQPFYRT